MRSFPLFLGALAVLLLFHGQSRADDLDREIRGKTIREWFNVLKTEKDVRQRRLALISLQVAGPRIPKIFDALAAAAKSDTEEVVRTQAVQVIGRLGAEARDPILAEQNRLPIGIGLEALVYCLGKDKSPTVREAAAAAIGHIGPDAKEGVEFLGAALKDKEMDVRIAAADSLGRIGPASKDAIDNLALFVKEAKGKEAMRGRMYGVTAFTRIGKEGAKSAVPVLIDLLAEPEINDDNPEVKKQESDLRRAAVEALGQLGEPRGIEAIARTLEDAMTLREIKRGERTIKQPKDVELSRAAMSALNQFGSERKAVLHVFRKALAQDQDAFVRCQALAAAGSLGKEITDSDRKFFVDELRKGLSDKLSDVKLASILALGEIGPDALGDDLKAVVADLRVATRAPQKAIGDAATQVLKVLDR